MRTVSRINHSSQEENFWPSFTDMISTIAIILFFLILIIFLKNIIIGKEYNLAKSDLAATQDALLSTEDDLLSTEEALLEKADQIAMLNAEISESEANLMLLQDQADALKLEVENGLIQLALSQAEIEDQQTIIANSNQQLGDMRTKIEQIAVIRLTVLEQVKEAIEKELQDTGVRDTDVQIASNGNIILNNQLLFGSNSYDINADGQVVLGELANVFESILRDPDIRGSIDAIQIEGHTDDVDTAEYNRDLSANRAISVVNYMFNANPDLEANYGEYFVASAFSEYRPINTGSSEAAKAENRRIEISIILKDSNIQEIVDSYLQDTETMFEGN